MPRMGAIRSTILQKQSYEKGLFSTAFPKGKDHKMRLLCLSDLHLRSEAVVAAIDRQRLSRGGCLGNDGLESALDRGMFQGRHGRLY